MSNHLNWELHCSNTKLVVYTPDNYSYHLHQEPDGVGWYVNAFSPLPIASQPMSSMVELAGKNMFDAMLKAQQHYDHRHDLMVVTNGRKDDLQVLPDNQDAMSAVKR